MIKGMKNLKNMFSVVSDLSRSKEIFWKNPDYENGASIPFTIDNITDAEKRLERFAPYLQKVFPELEESNGIIESEILKLDNLKQTKFSGLNGKLLMKSDHSLPISGSIKARGGIYEVLKFAEEVAIKEMDFTIKDDYTKLATEEFKKTFSKYRIAVGSTGNLGLSIGIMSAKLGFKVTVHMSKDAKSWKKELLKDRGVEVIEHDQDYGYAVKEGRENSVNNPYCHFIDDEASEDLFLGYSVSALRVKKQLDKLKIKVNEDKPLFVYLPCGVGGGPGGVAFGLKLIFGENVHPIFIEPVEAPCMLLGMVTKMYDNISVQDIGLSGKTIADGLAVGRPSKLVGNIMTSLLFGTTTVEDKSLYSFMKDLYDTENIFVEPSAASGFQGLIEIKNSMFNQKNATHLIWSTGGDMVPAKERENLYKIAVDLEK